MILKVAVVVALAAAPKARLLLQDITPGAGVEPSVAQALTSAAARELERRRVFEVVTSSDVATMLGVERQKQLLGCDEGACLEDLGGALGARFITTGSLARVGATWQLSVQTIDATTMRSIGRSVQLAADPSELVAAIPFIIAEAAGLPRPEKPSLIGPAATIIGGVVVALAGSVVLVQSVVKEGELQRELALSVEAPNLLRPASAYEADAQSLRTERLIGGIGVGVGAAVAVAGVVWLVAGGRSPSTSVALVPTHGGAALSWSGTFP